MKEGYEKSSANYKYYFAGKMNSNYLSAFDSFIENNKTFNNIADFIKSDNRIISLEELTSRMEKASGVSDYWDNFYKSDCNAPILFVLKIFPKTLSQVQCQASFL